jgi:ribosomal protein S18 acetylase RimI-like enzyme
MYVRDSSKMPTFALEEKRTLLGFVTLREHFAHAWEVHCIAVDAQHRGSGIGTRLLQHAETWLSNRGVRFLQIKTVHTDPDDPYCSQTRAFYLHRGYASIEVFPELWSPNNPALQLIKQIASDRPKGDR